MNGKTGVIGLITSQQFIVSVVGLLVGVLIAAVPALEASQDALIASITAIVLVLVGGISYVDGQMVKAAAELERAQMGMDSDRETRAYYASQSSPQAIASTETVITHYDADAGRMAALLALDELLNHADAGNYDQARTVIRKMVTDEARIQLYSVG